MLRNSQRLLTLINQLLDLSRFDSGKMKLQVVCQNIVFFLKGILASFNVLALQNQLNLEFHSEEKEISLYFDVQKMEEVMYNLLINAVFAAIIALEYLTVIFSLNSNKVYSKLFLNFTLKSSGDKSC